MKACIFLLLALAVSASALCFPGREYVYAKGHAKVNVYSHYEYNDLRVELVSYRNKDPKNATIVASANADYTGFYVVGGSHPVPCHFPHQYGLRLSAPKITSFPVEIINGTYYDTIEIPSEYVNVEWSVVHNESQPVKFFEKDIDGDLGTVS